MGGMRGRGKKERLWAEESETEREKCDVTLQ